MAEIARGQLSDRPFVRTLYTIAAKRFTGDLVIEIAGATYRIAWHRGLVVAADVPGATGSLAERALSLFALGTDGAFALDDASLVSEAGVNPLDARWLIFHGLVGHYDDDRLKRETAVLAMRPLQIAEDALVGLEAFGLEAVDQPWVRRLLAQPCTLDELLAEATDARRLRALVYALVATDAMRLADASASASPSPSPSPAPAPRPARATTPAPVPRDRPVSIDPGNAAVADANALRQIVTDRVQLMEKGADHFAMLGVPRNASLAAIRRVYFDLAKQLHPDRVQALQLGALAGPAGKVFARVNEAFAVLSNDDKRQQYLASLSSGAAAADQVATTEQVARLLEAEEKFRLGEMALRRSHFHQAVEDFDQAVALNPDEGEHHAMAAYARFMDARDKAAVLADVRRRFRKALSLSPDNANVLFYRGKVAKESSDYDTALYCFERALALDKQHEPAFREKKVVLDRMAGAAAKR
jgi:curved DNA-binding protein CbpA